uniref:Uncharacterized protein n=1 Tax=Salix viminalis TaxID=40686 RepID=A0A6N2KMZ3_SALVM
MSRDDNSESHRASESSTGSIRSLDIDFIFLYFQGKVSTANALEKAMVIYDGLHYDALAEAVEHARATGHWLNDNDIMFLRGHYKCRPLKLSSTFLSVVINFDPK